MNRNNNPDDQSRYVAQVQSILRDLSYWLEGNPAVAVDGSYDNGTRQAVTEFQRRFGLPATGNVDGVTWRALHDIHRLYSNYYKICETLSVFPETLGYEMTFGERGVTVMIIQAILAEMSSVYNDLYSAQPTGIFDEETAKGVSSYQEIAGLPVTGRVDRYTWNRLAAEYNALLKNKYTE